MTQRKSSVPRAARGESSQNSFTPIPHDQFLSQLCTAIGRTARVGRAFLFGIESGPGDRLHLAIVTDAGRFKTVTNGVTTLPAGRRAGYVTQDLALDFISAWVDVSMRQLAQSVEAGRAVTSVEAEALRQWTEIRADGSFP